MTRKQKKMLVRILVTALLTGVFLLIPEGALKITITKDLDKGLSYRKITIE